MLIKNAIAILFIGFTLTKSQTICNYLESSPVSNGYTCFQNTLIFTNSLNTIVYGSLIAEEEVIIQPNSAYSIALEVPKSCIGCTDGGGPTVSPKKNGGGKDPLSKLSNTTVFEVVKEGLSIDKNPVTDMLSFSLGSGKIKEFIIYDMNGKEIMKKISLLQKENIDISKMLKGAYMLKVITTNNKTFTKQFIKN